MSIFVISVSISNFTVLYYLQIPLHLLSAGLTGSHGQNENM